MNRAAPFWSTAPLRRPFRTNGETIAAHEEITLARRDYSDLVARIKAAHPDAVYVAAYGTESGILRKEMVEAGLANMPLYGSGAIIESDFGAAAGPAAVNSFALVMNPNGMFLKNPLAERYVQSYEAYYGIKPTQSNITTYVAAEIAIEAIRNALARNNGKRPTRAQVRDLLAQTRGCETAIGPVSFTPDGDMRNPYMAYDRFDERGQAVFIRQFRYESR